MATDYAKLTSDLRDAIAAAVEAAAKSDDWGTCNLDTLELIIDRGRLDRIETAAKLAGAAYVSRYTPRRFSIGIRAGGQGNSRTRAVEAARDTMRAAGWIASVRYVTD